MQKDCDKVICSKLVRMFDKARNWLLLCMWWVGGLYLLHC